MTVRQPSNTWATVAAAAGLVVFVGIGVAVPRAAAGGWLVGLVCVVGVPLGSLALLIIHGLTGGRWGIGMRPVLLPAAAAIPVVAIFFVPLLVVPGLIFPWARPFAGVSQSVADIYLNAPSFAARTAVALAGWCGLALMLPRLRSGAGRVLSACGMIFYALSISVVAVDWILSTEPTFVSTSFGASLAIAEIAAALAFAALFAPFAHRAGRGRAISPVCCSRQSSA